MDDTVRGSVVSVSVTGYEGPDRIGDVNQPRTSAEILCRIIDFTSTSKEAKLVRFSPPMNPALVPNYLSDIWKSYLDGSEIQIEATYDQVHRWYSGKNVRIAGA